MYHETILKNNSSNFYQLDNVPNALKSRLKTILVIQAPSGKDPNETILVKKTFIAPALIAKKASTPSL